MSLTTGSQHRTITHNDMTKPTQPETPLYCFIQCEEPGWGSEPGAVRVAQQPNYVLAAARQREWLLGSVWSIQIMDQCGRRVTGVTKGSAYSLVGSCNQCGDGEDYMVRHPRLD
jgi:hypothetical protein